MTDELTSVGGEFVHMPLASKNPVMLLANARRIGALIAKERIDIVHARSRAPAWSAFLACRRAGVPIERTNIVLPVPMNQALEGAGWSAEASAISPA